MAAIAVGSIAFAKVARPWTSTQGMCMQPVTAQKICGICGLDCAGRPRIKDKTGKYYCKACYDQALTKKRGVTAPQIAPSSSSPPAQDDDEFSMLNALLAEQQSHAVALDAARQCANCRASLASDAVVCVNCGFNVQSGRPLQVQTDAAAPPLITESKPRIIAGKTTWPLIIGIICMVLGAPGALMYGFGLIATLMSERLTWADHQKELLITLGTCGFGLSFSAWLFIAGLGVMQRTQSGMRLLRRWAVFTIRLVVIFGGLLLWGLSVMMNDPSLQQGRDPALLGATFGTIAVGAIITLIWPVFVLIWSSLGSVRAEVENWY